MQIGGWNGIGDHFAFQIKQNTFLPVFFEWSPMLSRISIPHEIDPAFTHWMAQVLPLSRQGASVNPEQDWPAFAAQRRRENIEVSAVLVKIAAKPSLAMFRTARKL